MRKENTSSLFFTAHKICKRGEKWCTQFIFWENAVLFDSSVFWNFTPGFLHLNGGKGYVSNTTIWTRQNDCGYSLSSQIICKIFVLAAYPTKINLISRGDAVTTLLYMIQQNIWHFKYTMEIYAVFHFAFTL